MITYLKVLKFNIQEERAVRQKLYPLSFPFETADRALKQRYRFLNPYQMCRKFLQKQGEQQIHAYGETPLTVMQEMAFRFAIGPEDLVYDLGAGRGRAALFLALAVGANVRAIEQQPTFCEIARGMQIPRLDMRCEDFFSADLSNATVIYLYGTMLSAGQIRSLIQNFKTAKIITVSYPLSDYGQDFEVIDKFEGKFPWGKTTIYLNRRKK